MAIGMLVDGQWQLAEHAADTTGRFVRSVSGFRERIGSPGIPPAADRYHLYVSYACPWAHRTLVIRALKRLEDAIGVSVVSPLMLDEGWEWTDFPGVVPDTVNGARALREVYTRADPHFTGRVTVPVLWDKNTGQIVNNESREILRMLDREMDAFAGRPVSYCPPALEGAVDAMISANYDTINNGVYRAGFAHTQAAYEEAIEGLYGALDRCEKTLAHGPWLLGDQLTEADICLFTTLVRFDLVYYVHFKCNRRHIWDFPNLWAHTRRLYALPGVRGTVHFQHIVHHYYRSHPHLNPRGIVPVGPDMERMLASG